ncbi:MAG: efflux transporter outer membrane subunit, partial [Proteobacteria bacterium]|nr:efflux transporter outer membrane subunit [Pseudomonadota bacterium]
DLYAEGFDASWEADLFGGVRRSVEAAGAQEEASREGFRNVLVSLAAEVGVSYVNLRAFQARLAVARENLRLLEDTRDLAQWRGQAGLASSLDLERADAQLQGARAQIPSLESGMRLAAHRLAVLLGQAPGSLDWLLEEPGDVPLAPGGIAVGIPAQALARRPDVRQADRLLAAQTARIGVARADLYPRLGFSGSIGLDALAAGGLLDSSNARAGFGPRLSWRLFDGNAVRANIQAQDALAGQALATWEGTVLKALEEVENALRSHAAEKERLQALTRAEQAAQSASKLALDEYASGLSGFESVLDAQRSSLSYQDQRVQSEAALSTGLITLYKALGGGWTPEPAGP